MRTTIFHYADLKNYDKILNFLKEKYKQLYRTFSLEVQTSKIMKGFIENKVPPKDECFPMFKKQKSLIISKLTIDIMVDN